MAEWSKAADLSSVIFGCVGSNPTSGTYNYNIFVARIDYATRIECIHTHIAYNILSMA